MNFLQRKLSIGFTLTALLLVTSTGKLSASQTTSLFYERQTQVTTLSAQSSAVTAAATATLSAIEQTQADSHTSDSSTSSTTTAYVRATNSGTDMSDTEMKQIQAYRAQQENIQEQEMKIRVDATAYNQAWAEPLGSRQQRVAANIYDTVTCLPQDIVKLIAQYAYEFWGVCVTNFPGHGKCVKKVCTLSDGRFVSLTSDYRITLANPATTSYVGSLGENNESIGAMADLGDNKFAVAENDIINVWDLTTKNIEYSLTNPLKNWLIKPISALCILPNQQLISADETGKIHFWNLATKKWLRTINAHRDRIPSLIALPDNRFASCSIDGTIKIWSTTQDKPLHTFNIDKHATGICILLPDNKLASVSSCKPQKGALVQIWDLRTLACINNFKSLSKPLNIVALPDNMLALNSYDDAAINILDMTTGKTKKISLGKPANETEDDMEEVYLMGISADNKLITTLESGTIHIWR